MMRIISGVILFGLVRLMLLDQQFHLLISYNKVMPLGSLLRWCIQMITQTIRH